jgi:hypothetical protein
MFIATATSYRTGVGKLAVHDPHPVRKGSLAVLEWTVWPGTAWAV